MKKENMNKKNPEWKVLVNERGFIREQQEIPTCGRNDSAPCDSKGEGGGKAAAFQSSSLNDIVVIPNGTQCSEETQPLCTPKTPSFRRSVATEETHPLCTPKTPSFRRSVATEETQTID